MTVILAICVGVTFAVSIYLILGRELKEIAMGTFLITHAANLSIIAMAGSPMIRAGLLKRAPILSEYGLRVDALPQALILTAIVVGVATAALGLALAVRIKEAYGTIEEDEIVKADILS